MFLEFIFEVMLSSVLYGMIVKVMTTIFKDMAIKYPCHQIKRPQPSKSNAEYANLK